MSFKNINREKHLWQDLMWMVIISAIVSTLVVIIFHLYEIDLSTMIYVQEDAIGVANAMHEYIIGINAGQGLTVFIQSIFSSNLEGAFLHRIGMFLCCLFFDNFGTAVNFYYFFGYILVALGMYLAMRFIYIEPWISACAGLLYTFLPYHYLRGESHVFLACFYMVPLACAVIVRLMKKDKKESKTFYIKCFVIAILMGMTDIYYSVFWAIILAFTCVYILVNSFDWKRAGFVLCYAFIPFGCIGIVNIPYLMNLISEKSSLTANFVGGSGSERTLNDLLFYGLRVVQLVSPIQNHRLGVLANFRNNLDQYLGADETRMVTLGLIMSIGFIITVCVVLLSIDKNEICNKLKKYGVLNIFILLVASIGGLNIFVGLLSANIRCYNRMSIFIAAFSLMALAELVQHWWTVKNKNRFIIIVICLLSLIGVWDQTAPFSREEYTENWNLDHNIKDAVQKIDAMSKDNARILMFPIILKNDDARIHDMRNYEQSWPRLYSDNLQWIMKSKDNEQWLSAMSVLPLTEQLKYFIVEDVDGIWLDENGYSADEFATVKNTLDDVVGEPVVVSETGKQYYYSLENYRMQFLEQKSEQEINDIKLESNEMRNSTGYYVGVSDLQVSGGESSIEDGSITLHQGELQYGPYLTLKAGKYQMEIVGENLQNADFQIYCDGGNQIIDCLMIESGGTDRIVSFELQENTSNIEFILSNNHEQDITLKYYYIDRIK